MARPAAPMARPNVQRPQMPMARPNVQRPNVGTQRPSMPNMQRPSPNMQRPNLGNMQRPGMTRPSLPSAGNRPAQIQRPNIGMSRPGLGTPRPGGIPGIANRPAPTPGGLGGLNRPTTLPGQINRPGAGLNRPTTLPGQLPGQLGGGQGMTKPWNRPSLGGVTKPSFPQPGLPNRPGIGGNRPGGNFPGLGNRPTTLPGNLGNNRPGIGGNRPGIGNRPTTLPGDLGNNRPGIGGNRPGINGGNTIGSGNWGNNNTLNNLNNNNFNNINVGGWNGGGYGGWGYPGYGGGWANNWNNGYVNPHYGNWYNSCWTGNWSNGGGWWAPFALGAATWGLASTVSNWGLGYGYLGYGGGAYVNPYYSSIPAAFVAASPYDYSQPIVVNNYIPSDVPTDVNAAGQQQASAPTAESPAAPVVSESDRLVDEALAKFKAGDYGAALAGCDKALKLSPKDSVVHEVRALALFAFGRYPEAAATLNAVLAVAPGMDWTTLSGLYDDVDTYTAQLRKLEAACKANPGDAAAHFVLAYHYLVGGYADMAAEALKVVVAKQPDDAVAKRLLEAITPPKDSTAPAQAGGSANTATQPAAPAAGPETDLVGSWKATSGKDSVLLTITEDSKFTWKAVTEGKPPVELSGTISTASDAIALQSESAGTMTAKVASKGSDAFDFALAGAPPEVKPLAFQRVK